MSLPLAASQVAVILPIPDEIFRWLHLGSLGLALAAVVIATMGRKSGLIVAGLTTVVYDLVFAASHSSLPQAGVSGSGFENLTTQLIVIAVALAIGFGTEPFGYRRGVRIFRLDRNIQMGAAIGLLLALFIAPMRSFEPLVMLLGAFTGAVIAGIWARSPAARAGSDAVGAMLGIFGAEGIRLFCTLSVVLRLM